MALTQRRAPHVRAKLTKTLKVGATHVLSVSFDVYTTQQTLQHCIQYTEDLLFAFLASDVKRFNHAAVWRLSFLLKREWFCAAVAPLIPEEPRVFVEYCICSRVIFCLDRQVHDAFTLGRLAVAFIFLLSFQPSEGRIQERGSMTCLFL